MLKPQETETVLAYIDKLIEEQERVTLSGAFNKIEEYKAACTSTRNLRRIREAIAKVYEKAEALEQADIAGLTIQPEKDTTR